MRLLQSLVSISQKSTSSVDVWSVETKPANSKSAGSHQQNADDENDNGVII